MSDVLRGLGLRVGMGGAVEGDLYSEVNASWAMVTWVPPPPVNRQTDRSENINFPQLR